MDHNPCWRAPALPLEKAREHDTPRALRAHTSQTNGSLGSVFPYFEKISSP